VYGQANVVERPKSVAVSEGKPRPHASGDPDAPMIRRVLAGDVSAFGEIVHRHERSLRRLVTGIVSDRQLAEDVVQESLWIAYRRLADFRGEAALETWLTRITIREAVRARTRARRIWRRFVPLEFVQDPVEPASSESREAARDLEEVLATLARLSVRERTALLLHVVEGHSYAETASILEMPIGTVGSLISRARAKLRERCPDSTAPGHETQS
jgi:RNA polymerase sigma-70 factor (ECF subfamily)